MIMHENIKSKIISCENIDAYLQFYNSVINKMEHPEWMKAVNKTGLINSINNGTKIFCYYYNDELIASMRLTNYVENELEEINFKNYDKKNIATYGSFIVEPKYRGNKIQSYMVNKIEEYIKNTDIKLVLLTVHPNNIHCINNALNCGFEQYMNIELKRGPRVIMLKTIE